MRNFWMMTCLAGLVLIFTGVSGFSCDTCRVDSTRIEQLSGFKGKWSEPERVFKLSVPRNDLHVTVAGVKMVPAMGLTSWAAFKGSKDKTMVMGDLVLTEDQVNPVLDIALKEGLEVTALHNHFLGDSPKILFMHIAGKGSEEKLAVAVGKVLTADQASPIEKFPNIELDPTKTSLNPATIESQLGVKGDLMNGVYKVTIGRTVKMGKMTMGNAMGINTWAAFVGSDDQAVVDGDFAMLESELQGVLKALRSSGISIVAIHSHMIQESPRMIFLHYWGIGSTTKLAQGIKAALATQKLN